MSNDVHHISEIRKSSTEAPRSLRPIELPPLGDSSLVSVLVANYNYAEYIGEAIESVLKQTYPHFEVVVCDDGSTDNSREVIAGYQKHDDRVRLVCQTNAGVSAALNTAYAACRGEIISLLDADDIFHVTKLERVVRTFQAFPNSGLCLHRSQKINKIGRPFGYSSPIVFPHGWVGDQALHGGGRVQTMPQATALSFRRSVTDDLLFPIPTDLKRLADGYLCYSAQFFTEVCSISSTLAYIRDHGGNVSGLGIFTTQSVGRYLDDFEFLLGHIRRLLAAHYGEDISTQLKLEENSQYWSFLLALYVLGDERGGEIRGESVRHIVEHISPRRQQALASLLVALPRPLGRLGIRFWNGRFPGSAVVTRVMRTLLRF